MTCPKCLGKNPEDAKFCTECGTTLSATAADDANAGDAKAPVKAAIKKLPIILTIAIIGVVAAISVILGFQQQAKERREREEWKRQESQGEFDRHCHNPNAETRPINGRRWHVEPCFQCGGSGRVSNGYGTFNCMTCSGYGAMKCRQCGGGGVVY